MLKQPRSLDLPHWKKKLNNISVFLVKVYMFPPLAVERIGPWSMQPRYFMSDRDLYIGLEMAWQRISLAIQSGNAASLLSSLKTLDVKFEEVFLL